MTRDEIKAVRLVSLAVVDRILTRDDVRDPAVMERRMHRYRREYPHLWGLTLRQVGRARRRAATALASTVALAAACVAMARCAPRPAPAQTRDECLRELDRRDHEEIERWIRRHPNDPTGRWWMSAESYPTCEGLR